MSSLIINLLYITGFIFLFFGGIEVYKKFNRNFTDAHEILKLRDLNKQIRSDMSQTLMYSRNCFKIFNILSSTRYKDSIDPAERVTNDEIWQRSREYALKSAHRGYKNCNKFLKISLERPDIILLREAFAYASRTCHECPILEGTATEMNNCPVVGAFENQAGRNE